VSAAHVIKVAGPGELVAVPGAQPEILGVRNVSGQILPVIDLAALLRIPHATPAARLLVVADRDRMAGFAVDELIEVGDLGEPTEETESSLLRGALFADGDLVGVIDVARVFDALAGAPPSAATAIPRRFR